MPTGCPMPDTCMPLQGPIGIDGSACPVTCPVTCPLDHIQCPGGVMPDGCMMPDTCMPQTEECPTIVEPAPVCENIHADSKCIKNKNKGKCGKKWMKKKCKKECGYC